MIDAEWDLSKFVMHLRSKKIEWQVLYWKLIACTLDYKCAECDQRFAGNLVNQCTYHEKAPFCGIEPTELYYPCCNDSVLKFDTKLKRTGCQTKYHKLHETQTDRESAQQKRKVSFQ